MGKSRGRSLRGLGSRLQTLRLHLRYSISKMANKLGVHPNTVCRYESGDIIPGFLCLSRLQKDCDVSMDWLLFNRGPMFFPEKGPGIEEAAPPAEELSPEINELVTGMKQDPVLWHEIMLFFHRAAGTRGHNPLSGHPGSQIPNGNQISDNRIQTEMQGGFRAPAADSDALPGNGKILLVRD